MAGGRRGPLLTALLAAWVGAVAAAEEDARPEQAALPEEWSLVLPKTASHWTLVMEGEWMLKFYTPWCPSCQQTDSEWEIFAKNEKEELGDDEAEEEEEDGPAAGADEERGAAQDVAPREAREDVGPEVGPGEALDAASEQRPSADAEVAEDTLRQRRSQHADKGPSA
ncbi:Thioredoxin-related transmembrane protein 4 [Camelus dromedarius]|uniref:Thioredoxin-related transmembrane protein 4 n=1 Tax=Camelus dromedarius TaxID=9838 RepID=A0A5N4DN22_CAMDR|nr:Thioredoxin-related transmembrane protein 4 [Camelus dromedarius]